MKGCEDKHNLFQKVNVSQTIPYWPPQTSVLFNHDVIPLHDFFVSHLTQIQLQATSPGRSTSYALSQFRTSLHSALSLSPEPVHPMFLPTNHQLPSSQRQHLIQSGRSHSCRRTTREEFPASVSGFTHECGVQHCKYTILTLRLVSWIRAKERAMIIAQP